jgi:hypothetical protein
LSLVNVNYASHPVIVRFGLLSNRLRYQYGRFMLSAARRTNWFAAQFNVSVNANKPHQPPAPSMVNVARPSTVSRPRRAPERRRHGRLFTAPIIRPAYAWD